MALQFLFDENLRGIVPQVVARVALREGFKLVIEQVGDLPELPLGSLDPFVLRWAADHDFVLVSEDVRTMPEHLAELVRGGRTSPGVLIARQPFNAALAEFLVLIAVVSDPREWQNQIQFVP